LLNFVLILQLMRYEKNFLIDCPAVTSAENVVSFPLMPGSVPQLHFKQNCSNTVSLLLSLPNELRLTLASQTTLV
jgi:hypothetical protein